MPQPTTRHPWILGMKFRRLATSDTAHPPQGDTEATVQHTLSLKGLAEATAEWKILKEVSMKKVLI